MKKDIGKSSKNSMQINKQPAIDKREKGEWHLFQGLQWTEVLIGSIISIVAITASVYLGTHYPLKHKPERKYKHSWQTYVLKRDTFF